MCETLEAFFEEKLALMPSEVDDTSASQNLSRNRSSSNSGNRLPKKRSREAPASRAPPKVLSNKIF